MVGAAVERLEMNVGVGATGEAFKEVVHQFGLEVAHQPRAHLRVDNRGRASAEINGCDSKSFIHGHDKVAGAHDAALIAERRAKCLAQRNTDIFDRMVLVDIEIALGLNLEVENTVTREQLQHVVEKADARLYFVPTATFDGQSQPDIGFRGRAMEGGLPHFDTPGRSLQPICSSTDTTRSISACVPTLMRTQPAQSARLRRARP